MIIGHIQNMTTSMVDEILEDSVEHDTPKEAAIRRNLVNGKQIAVLNVACLVEHGKPEHNYYDVVFADGTMCDALAGYHIQGIAHWNK